jgi:hypothetical protein
MLTGIALCTSLGLALVALADVAAREGRGGKNAAFWAGIALIVLPALARVAAPGAGRRERIGIALIFGLGLYLVKVSYDPSAFAFSDEFVHFRSVRDDLVHGSLFSFNPLLPEAARYPGLGDIAVGLVRLTGLPIATVGLIVIGAARVTLTLALFLLAERISGSPRVAGLACLLYAANPNFLYWSAQFSYESLALPLVVFTVYLVAKRSASAGAWRLDALAGASILAVVITHHLSSYFLAAVLLAWSAVVFARRARGHGGGYSPAALALVAVAAIGTWIAVVAPITGQYLGSIASSTGKGLFNVITGASATRQLFTSGAEVAPLWERLLGIGSVALTLAALVMAALVIWRRRRQTPLLLAPLLLSLIYPLLLPLRFIGGAAETANRSTEFVFLGVGSVLAAGVLELRARRRFCQALLRPTALLAGAVVVLGGIAVAWQYSERLPQDPLRRAVPYELSASAVSAERWSARVLGPGHRFASDFLDHLGLAAYGLQRPLWAPSDGVSAWQVLAPPRVDASVRRAIRAGGIEYVMVERRLSYGIPSSGYYFDKGEPQAGHFERAISPRTLAKFDRARGASRVYDNGQEQIYAVAALR